MIPLSVPNESNISTNKKVNTASQKIPFSAYLKVSLPETGIYYICSTTVLTEIGQVSDARIVLGHWRIRSYHIHRPGKHGKQDPS